MTCFIGVIGTGSLIPEPGKREYNSNSFHLGFLNAIGLGNPSFVTDAGGYAGASNPLPLEYFR